MKTLGLSTPINRLGFVVLCAGAVITIVSFLGSYESYGWSGRHFASIERLFFDRALDWWQTGVRWGVCLTIIGAWMAWAFEPTIGKLWKWIKTGPA